jgi:hypothetical protein
MLSDVTGGESNNYCYELHHDNCLEVGGFRESSNMSAILLSGWTHFSKEISR